MPAEKTDPDGRAPSPTDGPPTGPSLSVDFSDLADQLKAHGLIPPDEAAEAMDDAEAEELALMDEVERIADGLPGAKRTWAELDAADEADRRFDLDAVATASEILARHARAYEDESSGDIRLRMVNVPDGFEEKLDGFLDGVHALGMRAMGRLADHA